MGAGDRAHTSQLLREESSRAGIVGEHDMVFVHK